MLNISAYTHIFLILELKYVWLNVGSDSEGTLSTGAEQNASGRSLTDMQPIREMKPVITVVKFKLHT